MDRPKCRHGNLLSESCPGCKSEMDHLDAFRRDERRRNDEAVSEARRRGTNYTFTDVDGCEVTATPGGHVFFNMSDWF